MTDGLLWFDDDPRKRLEDKVSRAMVYYERKYGHRPDLCLVHPSTFNQGGMQQGDGNDEARRETWVDSVEVRPGRSVMPDHLWLGLDEHSHDPAVIGG
jgi:hypothetical protein